MNKIFALPTTAMRPVQSWQSLWRMNPSMSRRWLRVFLACGFVPFAAVLSKVSTQERLLLAARTYRTGARQAALREKQAPHPKLHTSHLQLN
jgi:hypothetical protein